MSRLALAFAVLLASWAPSPASAKPNKPALQRAQRHIKVAERSFRDGDYEGAVEEFRAAERALDEGEIEPPAALFRSMARCHDQLGQITPALSHYRRFIALADEPKGKAQRRALDEAEDAVTRLQTLFDRTGLRMEVRPEGAEVRIDRRELGPIGKEVLRVKPGAHQLTVWAKGHEPASLTVEVAAGAVVPVVVELRPVGRPLQTGPPPSTGMADAWLIGAFGAVAAATGAGALTLALAGADSESKGDDLAGERYARPTEAQAARTRIQRHYDSAADDRGAALILGALAAAALTSAVTVWLSPGPGAPPAATQRPSQAP